MIICNGAKRLAVIKTRFRMFIPRAAISSVLVLFLIAFCCRGIRNDGSSCCWNLFGMMTEDTVVATGAVAFLMECANTVVVILAAFAFVALPF